MLQATFEEYLAERNLRAARLLSFLTSVIMPSGVVLDWFTHREQVLLLFKLRLASAVVAATCCWLTFRPDAKRHAYALGLVPVLGAAVALEVMIENLEGYSSPYYAGLVHALFALGVIFYWRVAEVVVACLLIVGVWVVPTLLQLQFVQISPFVNNFFAITVAAAIAIASNVSRYRSVQREYWAQAELVHALDRLKELDRLKSNFFSNVTHELRTPLTMILAPLEGLLDGDLGNLRQNQKAYLRPIQHNALKLLKLINDLLDLAKIDEQYLRLRVEPTDLVDLVSKVVEQSQPLAARKDIALHIDIRRSESDLQVDLERMERAIVNLLANALKFTEPGGQVTVLMDADDEEVRVSVQDSGIGISADQIESIFQRFSQADGSATRRYGGTGIGLALAKEIVELHGGKITVTSEPNKGSEFVIHVKRGEAHLRPEVLDRRQSASPEATGRRGEDREPREWTKLLLERNNYRFLEIAEATERRIATRAEFGPKASKILVVEDSPDVLRFVNMQLAQEHDVYLAQDGAKGVELAQRELPDVIITDYMMPEMDGLSLVRALRSDPRTANIPVIMLTAKTQVQHRIDAREAGAEIFLSKPFSPRELRSAVGQLLEQRGRQLSHTLHEQVKSLELISAGLAHEIHNPLGYIRSSLFVIEESMSQLQAAADKGDQGDLPAVIQDAREKIMRMHQIAKKGVSRITRTVELVRNYARDGYVREPAALGVDAMIKDLAPLFSPANDYEVQVAYDLNAQGARVKCIVEDMQRSVGNIWQNALDAVGQGGHVAIRTRLDSEFVIIEISDDGPGIPRDQLGRIFVPFYTTKGPGQGLGLGLSIAYQVVNQSGGSITVESVIDSGTTFRIRLPVFSDEFESSDTNQLPTDAVQQSGSAD